MRLLHTSSKDFRNSFRCCPPGASDLSPERVADADRWGPGPTVDVSGERESMETSHRLQGLGAEAAKVRGGLVKPQTAALRRPWNG